MHNTVIDFINNTIHESSELEEPEKCPICYVVDTRPQYTLPHCGHTFHTECILNWMRFGNSNCPYCNNVPEEFKKKSNIYSRTSSHKKRKFQIIKNFCKKDNAPKVLKEAFKKLEKMENELKKIDTDIKNLNNTTGSFKDLKKLSTTLITKRHSKKTQIGKLILDITSVHIMPFFIIKKTVLKK